MILDIAEGSSQIIFKIIIIYLLKTEKFYLINS